MHQSHSGHQCCHGHNQGHATHQAHHQSGHGHQQHQPHHDHGGMGHGAGHGAGHGTQAHNHQNHQAHAHQANHHGGAGHHERGMFVSNHDLRLLAGGAVGALALNWLNKLLAERHPAVVGVIKEGFSVWDWFSTQFEQTKENIEDIVAEAKHAHYHPGQGTANGQVDQEDLLRKIEQMIEEKLAQANKA